VCYAHHGINREHAIFGGNRCWTVSPSDLAPIMVALDAVIHTRDTGGEDSFPAARLFVPPSENITIMHRLQGGQILTAVEIPTRESRRSTFIKDTVRNSWNFSRISVAVALTMGGGHARNVRIVLGGAATIPWRVQAAEHVLEGAALNRNSIEKAAAASVKGATELNYNGYKVGLTRKLVREALTQLA
jgi:xanthine dehydrogenase YagS FAD-binding subunit